MVESKPINQRTKDKQVFQFKITLRDIKPAIWRRIHVPSTYSFWDLHVAIQDAMGWLDYHLHEFEIRNPKTGEIDKIGIDDGESDLYEILSDREKKIAKYFIAEKYSAFYLYDFGDGWEHDIVLEKILPASHGKLYPQIIDGARLCPPEDCGGTPGYQNFVKIMQNPRHPGYKDMLEWYGCKYNPEDWNPAQIRFDNPQVRCQQAFANDIAF